MKFEDNWEARLIEWIDLRSTTGEEAAYLSALETAFSSAGYVVERQNVAADRWNLWIVPPNTPNHVDVCFSTHVDTVPPHIPASREGDRINGRGACDTKGGLMAMARAAEQLRDEMSVGFLLVVGEEVDHCGAIAAKDARFTIGHIILCEPTINRVVSHQKGVLKVRWTATGIAGHSAFPHKGESAIHKLIEACREALTFGWPSHEVLGPTTLNVGTFKGGVAANVFAPEAEAVLMFRLVQPSQEVLQPLAAIAAKYGLAQEVMTQDEPQELFVPQVPKSESLPAPAPFATTTAAFNSDTVHLKDLAPVTLVGPGNIENAHSIHEHITVQDVNEGVALYVSIARALQAPK